MSYRCHTFHKLMLAALLVVSGGQALATGIPTIDVTNIVQTTETALQAIEQTANQLEQIRQAKKRLEQMTGQYNMGQLLNSAADRQLRRYVPRSWRETLAILQAGGLPGYQSQAQQAALEAQKRGQYYDVKDLYADPGSQRAKDYIRSGNQVYAAMGASQAAYDGTEDRYQRIETLSDEIDKTPNIKAAADLQSRLLSEQLALTNELVRQIAMLNVQLSEMREEDRNKNAMAVKMTDTKVVWGEKE